MAPATAASKLSCAPVAAAAAYSSSPCWASSALLPVTTDVPAARARRIRVRAGSMPPISSMTTSAPSTSASASVV